nr:putative reverse transcriptase domain-containing protein [Tanacetum cinerariifolium]
MKEMIKPKRIRAMNMNLQSSIKGKILAAQNEASDESVGLQRGLNKLVERRNDGALDMYRWPGMKKDITVIGLKLHVNVRKAMPIKEGTLRVQFSERIGPIAYRIRLPKELNGVHDTFYVSNLKKCLPDPTLQIHLDEIWVDAKLNFMEEPVEILEREFKKLKQSRIAIVKVRWNSKQGPEFMWEREDQMKLKDRYWWSGMKKDTVQPEIPEWKWKRIAMDFVTKLPRTSSRHDTIWVIVVRLTKSAQFLPMRKDY